MCKESEKVEELKKRLADLENSRPASGSSQDVFMAHHYDQMLASVQLVVACDHALGAIFDVPYEASTSQKVKAIHEETGRILSGLPNLAKNMADMTLSLFSPLE